MSWPATPDSSNASGAKRVRWPRLSHPNIAGVFDYGEDDSHYFIVMEYMDGRIFRRE